MLQFPGILLPIAVTVVPLPEQENIFQIVGLVCPKESFPFVVTSSSLLVKMPPLWVYGATQAVKWLAQILQYKSPTQGNSPCDASRLFKTELF